MEKVLVVLIIILKKLHIYLILSNLLSHKEKEIPFWNFTSQN